MPHQIQSPALLLVTYLSLLLVLTHAGQFDTFDCTGKDCITSGSDLINLDVTSARRRQTPVCNYYFEDVHKHTSPNYAYLPLGYSDMW